MSVGVTVISGMNPLFMRPLRTHASRFFHTDDVEMIIKPGIDGALAGPKYFNSAPQTLFALREEMQVKARRTLGPRPRTCMIIVESPYSRHEPSYLEYEDQARLEHEEVRSWGLFGNKIVTVCCVPPQFDFFEVPLKHRHA